MQTSGRALSIDLLALGFLLAIAFVWALPTPTIARHGEAREALVVADIVANDHWILPLRNGELPSKPPLFHWIGAALAKGFGLNDVTVRAPSALAGFGLAVITYLLGTWLSGRAGGWLAVGVLLGTAHFWEGATQARVDMVFSCAVAAALAGFLAWVRTGRASARVVSYLAVGAAVLAKGPAGAALPLLTVMAYCAMERTWAPLRGFWSWPLALAVIAADALWYGLALSEGGMPFVQKQLLGENLNRFLGRGEFGHASKRLHAKMLVGFATGLLPWNLALGWALWRRSWPNSESNTARLLSAWWIVPLIFFSLSAGERTIYLLPIYPAVAALAARGLLDLLSLAPAPSSEGWRALLLRNPVASLLIAVAVFDLSLATTYEVGRTHRAGDSLVSFATAVDSLLPPDTVIGAEPSCHATDIELLAYRLHRPIDVHAGACAEHAYCLAPASPAPALSATQREVVRSKRRTANMSLLQGDAASEGLGAGGAGALLDWAT